LQNIPRQTKDAGFKTVLGNHELFAQFLRDFIKIDMLRDVKPEDIEDITERFVAMGIDSKEGDTVKKIRVTVEEPFFIVGLAEHNQKVYHRMGFRFLEYKVFIWLDYERERNAIRKGASELKGFKYPPILPIVYYTGEGKWTAPTNFIDKVYFNDVFGKYIPKFEYILIDAKNYGQEDLLRNKDILSLFLIIDKIKRAEQISTLRDIPKEFFDELEASTPEHLRKLVREVVAMFLAKLDIPEPERDEVTEKILKRRFSEMFTLVDGYSVRETRIEAKRENTREIATNLLCIGVPVEMIAKATGLTREEVEELRNRDE